MEYRVLFVTGIVTPFWIEFSQAVNAYSGFQFSIAFTNFSLGDRGEHWRNCSLNLNRNYLFEDGDLRQWLLNVFSRFKPNIVISGGVRSKENQLAFEFARIYKCYFGIFAEQPNLHSPIIYWSNLQFYKWLFKIRKPDFLLAVGDRAVDIYRKLLPGICPVTLFPYHQNLSPAFQFQLNKISLPMRFLFSGRLIPRNSIKEMVAAFERLADRRFGEFVWCISAYGSEEYLIKEAMIRSEAFSKSIYFDRDFSEWNDRLRPFSNSDILIVPSKHSGWGLVVPEALASGIPVISTRYVEAARYFVEDMVNGFFVEPNTESIYKILDYCIDNIDIIFDLKKKARKSSLKGDVLYGAKKFTRLLKMWFPSPSEK